MRLNDKVYTILKWLTLVCIPAATTLYVALSAVWGWPYAAEIAKTSAAICTFLGAILGISTAEYNKNMLEEDDEPYIYPDEEDEEDEEE